MLTIQAPAKINLTLEVLGNARRLSRNPHCYAVDQPLR